MRPTVVASANANASAGAGGAGPNSSSTTSSNGVNIPISHEYQNDGGHYPQQSAQTGYYPGPGSAPNYGSPRQQQPYHHPQQQQPHSHQQIPAQFQQGFGFEPDMDMDMDMDMFPRSRLGRMHHDPFANFGNSTDFAFPQFNSLGRRRPAADHMGHEDDFFNRLPSEFRQYIPEGFGHRRAGSGSNMQPQQQQPPQYATHPRQPLQPQAPGQYCQYNGPQPQSPTKKLCDAAIQTEEPAAAQSGTADVVDSGSAPMHDNLQQHGLRNTVDMGVKSALEAEQHGPRSHSAPPNEPQLPVNDKGQTPPPQAGQAQFGTQTSPHVQSGAAPGGQQQPQFQKAYYAPQQQAHPQQQATGSQAQPQTPGGSYIRTIPIFVEGRSEPIINHKEIPNQHSTAGTTTASATATARAQAPPQQPQTQQQQQPQFHQHPQQQHRPTPLNTQQQPSQDQQAQQRAATGPVPQTPHTLDSISKIQDIQRDVLDLMGCVENFTGTRADREYMFLDEMLTRNLLKLDTIDTNGKDSIRLARKEAIKCIQASINVLEAKAEENARAAGATASQTESAPADETAATNDEGATQKSASKGEVASSTKEGEPKTDSATPSESQSQEAIPLPPPGGMKSPGVLAIAPAPVLALAPAPAPKENQPAIQTGDEQATTTAAETTAEAASNNNNGETK